MKKLYFLSRIDGNLGDYESCPVRHLPFAGFETIGLIVGPHDRNQSRGVVER